MLSDLIVLDVSSNAINAIDDVTFVGLINLRDLILSRNSIDNIRTNSLRHLNKLERLYLSNNRMRSIDKNFVAELHNLAVLDLSANSIASIDSTFLTSQSISYLKIESGSVEKINDFAFGELPNLRTLRLKTNRISEIAEKSFMTHNGSQVTSIDLTNNQLTTFPARPLQLTPLLQSLLLSYNPINTLCDDDVIKEPFLPSLTSLQLAYTEIDDVNEVSLLRRLTNLRSLIINNARLNRVPPSLLTSLPKLESLIMDSNPVSELSSDNFPIRHELKTFSLRFDNLLTEVIFNIDALSVEVIPLLDNPITLIHSYYAFISFQPLQDFFLRFAFRRISRFHL